MPHRKDALVSLVALGSIVITCCSAVANDDWHNDYSTRYEVTGGRPQRGLTTSNATTKPPKHPFGSAELADDTLRCIFGFLLVLTAAHPLGLLFPRFLKLPLITGYLIVGILTGPFVANLLTNDSVEILSSCVNAMALSFISFQAGQEIYLPELRPQIKGILALLMVLYVTAMVILTAVLTLGAGPFFYGSFDGACKLAIALMFGSIAVLGSPATVMAIKIELNSVGPFTNLMLGATMTAEFVVLVSFSISRVVSSVYCAKLDISLTNLMFTMGIVFSNILIGAIIGLVIIGIFSMGSSSHQHHDVEHHEDEIEPKSRGGFFSSLYFKGFIWLFMGYFFYISTNTISEATIAAYGHVWDVKLEPLLVLMVASCIAGHYGKIRHDMHVILDTAAPFIFLPFFVMTGAGLKLNQVAKAVPLMSLFVGLRYVAIFIACYCTGRWLLKLPPKQYNNLWLTMTPQAGVALGLANEVKGLSKDPWASEFAATIVAAVVVNQIVGPVLCAMGLKGAGEAGGKRDDGEEDDDLEVGATNMFPLPQGPRPPPGPGMRKLKRLSQAVVIGQDEIACEIALQLVLYGAKVAMPLLDDVQLGRWEMICERIQAGDVIRTEDVAVELAGITASSRGVAAPRQINEDTEESPELNRSRVAMASETDLILFTGDDQRAIDHVKMLQATSFGRLSTPRLVAITQTAESVSQLRNLGVFCVQSSVALSNVGVRMALMDDVTVPLYANETSSAEPMPNVLNLLSTQHPKASTDRILTQRGQLLARNARYACAMQQTNSEPGTEQVAPPRLSMFGLSSAVHGPEYFIGSGRGGARLQGQAHPQSRFVVPNDIYVMGGGQHGEGGFEEVPIHLDSSGYRLQSGVHGNYASANRTPVGNSRGKTQFFRKSAK